MQSSYHYIVEQPLPSSMQHNGVKKFPKSHFQNFNIIKIYIFWENNKNLTKSLNLFLRYFVASKKSYGDFAKYFWLSQNTLTLSIFQSWKFRKNIVKWLRPGIGYNLIVTSKIFWPHYAMQCKATENPYSTIHWQSHHHHKVHRGGPRTTITHSRIHDNDLWWKIILHFPQTTRMLLKEAWSQKVFQFGSNL